MRSVPLLLAMVFVAMAAAENGPAVYRWTDAQGVVHFADRPPGDQGAERVSVDPGRVNSVPPSPPGARGLSTLPAPRKQKRVKTNDRAEREKRCQSAKRQIGNIHARMRAGYNTKQGERLRERLRGYEKDRLRWCLRRGR